MTKAEAEATGNRTLTCDLTFMVEQQRRPRKDFSVCPRLSASPRWDNLCQVNLSVIGWQQSGKMSVLDVVGV